jgi:hypothetical protein
MKMTNRKTKAASPKSKTVAAPFASVPPINAATIAAIIERRLQSAVNNGAEQAQKFLARSPSDAESEHPEWSLMKSVARRIVWAESDVQTMSAGMLAAGVLHHAQRLQADADTPKAKAIATALGAELENQVRSLMHDGYRGGSTSTFSNAVDAANRAAACRFVGEFERLSKHLADQLAAEQRGD